MRRRRPPPPGSPRRIPDPMDPDMGSNSGSPTRGFLRSQGSRSSSGVRNKRRPPPLPPSNHGLVRRDELLERKHKSSLPLYAIHSFCFLLSLRPKHSPVYYSLSSSGLFSLSAPLSSLVLYQRLPGSLFSSHPQTPAAIPSIVLSLVDKPLFSLNTAQQNNHLVQSTDHSHLP